MYQETIIYIREADPSDGVKRYDESWSRNTILLSQLLEKSGKEDGV